MTDIRARINQLISDSGTYRQGQQDERQRLRTLIDIRIDQLRGTCGIRNREQLCAELLHLRQHLDL
ncbi:MAG: hypothetical protein ACK5S6_01080 [bacterium]|jgi:hypothetical protein